MYKTRNDLTPSFMQEIFSENTKDEYAKDSGKEFSTKMHCDRNIPCIFTSTENMQCVPNPGGALDQILVGDVPSRLQKHTRS